MSILIRERAELESQLKEDQGSPEICFTEQALELLTEREGTLFKKVGLAILWLYYFVLNVYVQWRFYFSFIVLRGAWILYKFVLLGIHIY